LTKEQRAAEALRKRQEEVDLQRKRQEEERQKRIEFSKQPSSSGGHLDDRRDRDRDR